MNSALSFFNGETYLDGLPVECDKTFPYKPTIGELLIVHKEDKSTIYATVQGVKYDFKNKCITAYVSTYD